MRAPAGTAFRFGTLVALAVVLAAQVAGQFAGTWRQDVLPSARCQVLAGVSPADWLGDAPGQAAYAECESTLVGTRLAWTAGWLAVLAVVALAVYLLLPRWRVRRDRLVPLRSVAPVWQEVGATLEALVARAGVRRAPEFLLDPVRPTAGGLAFGTRGRPRVCLDRGLVQLHGRDRASFEAVVLHELAHLRHGDVPTTYATIALWRAVLAVVLVPYLAVFLHPPLTTADPWRLPDWSALTGIGLVIPGTVLAITGFAFAARTSILRARELHADALVARWTGDTEPYRALVERPRGRLRALLAPHPPTPVRAAALLDPRAATRPGWWEVALAALAVQLLVPMVWTFLVSVREGDTRVLRLGWSLLVGVLVCVVAWRAAVGGSARLGLKPASGLAVGLLVGTLADFRVLLLPHRGLWALVLAHVLLAVTAVLVCCWAVWCARLLSSARPLVWALTGVAVLFVVHACLGSWPEAVVADQVYERLVAPSVRHWRDVAAAVDWLPGSAAVLTGATLPFVLTTDRVVSGIGLALLWLVPLLLAGRRAPAGFAALTGLCASAAVVVAVLGLRLLPHAATGPDQVLVLSAWELAAVVVGQAAAGAVALRRGLAPGLLAAWVVGLVGCGVLWAAHFLGGPAGSGDSVLAARPLQLLPFTGTVVVLLAAALRRSRRAGAAPRRPVFVLGVVAVVSVLALSWWPKAPASTALLAEPAPPVVDADSALDTWLQGGGFAAMQSAATTLVTYSDAVRAGQLDGIVSACVDVAAAASRARPYPPPEQAREFRDHWSAAVAAMASGAGKCVRSLRAGAGPDVARDGALDLNRASDELVAAFRMITG
ncbi:M48 family metallopeptidase [Actinokineospora bangkokensis]|uniref:Peptidase M48 domain-containing protein n=1 Tax=Actinokineospora bangkokensis TaxID=1193682 RepID=A0A1Q9LSG5_9PSEU|nr:M48 family metalloprotease [Actinokineospora bangkokensis]OLR94997.1 hypothetical protein BJP25_08520 [Actinokineospora bangkokensis]